MQNIKKVLKEVFGFDSFRDGQEEVVKSIVNKNDTLVFMPTWWWKSLTFQLPWIVFDGLTIVISPLISLMKDQVDSLRNLNIRTEVINSTITDLEQADILNELSTPNNEIKFLYIAPERLNSRDFIRIMQNVKVSLVAIDEAHCISQWWHDFRPSYMKINLFIENLRKVNDFWIVALTATATRKVREDIVVRLWLEKPEVFTKWFDRKNIIIIVREISKKDDKNQKLKEIVDNTKWSWIVYCSSRKKTKEVYDFLISSWVKTWLYTWAMNSTEREKEQENFMTSKYKVIVATNAFGMWIDKKDIRFVIHYNLPWSIENYYQEVWRAWRDWKLSYWVVLASYSDTKIQEFFIENTYPEKQEVLNLYDYMYKWFKIWEWKNYEILKTYWVMGKESAVWNDMKVWSIIKIIEKYWVIKKWYQNDSTSDFRWRWVTLNQEKRKHEHILIDWTHQDLLKEEWYYKLDQIKKLLFYPSCRKRFILDYFWDEEDLKTLWENCNACDYCIEKQKYKQWKIEKVVQLSVFSIVLEVIDEFDKRFWVKVITSFLRWSKDKRLIEWNLDKRNNYSVLSEYNVELVEALIEALIRQDFVEKSIWKYPTIWLTTKWKVSLTRDYLLKEDDNDLQSFLSMRVKSSAFKKLKSDKEVKEKVNTYYETLKLFKAWKSLKDISKTRELKILTIENHILSLYKDSEIWLNEIMWLVNFSNVTFVKQVINDDFLWNVEKLKPIKDKLEELWKKDITYFEIKTSIAMIEKKDL